MRERYIPPPHIERIPDRRPNFASVNPRGLFKHKLPYQFRSISEYLAEGSAGYANPTSANYTSLSTPIQERGREWRTHSAPIRGIAFNGESCHQRDIQRYRYPSARWVTGHFRPCDRRLFRHMPHISAGKVSFRYGHCGLAEISAYPTYRTSSLCVGLGIAISGGFGSPYRPFGLGVPPSRWFRIFISRLSFASGVGFNRPAPKTETTANDTGPRAQPPQTGPDQTKLPQTTGDQPIDHPPERAGLFLDWALSFSGLS